MKNVTEKSNSATYSEAPSCEDLVSGTVYVVRIDDTATAEVRRTSPVGYGRRIIYHTITVVGPFEVKPGTKCMD